jgi:hypothetical protein
MYSSQETFERSKRPAKRSRLAGAGQGVIDWTLEEDDTEFDEVVVAHGDVASDGGDDATDENSATAHVTACAKVVPLKFKGASWHKSSQKWQVRIQVDGKARHLGLFDNEEEAARKYDEVGGNVETRKTSKFKGVSWYKYRQKCKAQIKVDGKSKYLGIFDDEKEAARKYDEAFFSLKRLTKFSSKNTAGLAKKKFNLAEGRHASPVAPFSSASSSSSPSLAPPQLTVAAAGEEKFLKPRIRKPTRKAMSEAMSEETSEAVRNHTSTTRTKAVAPRPEMGGQKQWRNGTNGRRIEVRYRPVSKVFIPGAAGVFDNTPPQ